MRQPRRQSEADIYHVIARGTGRQIIFEEDDDYRKFLEILAAALSRTKCELYAWCLMDNHVHLLFHAPLENISQCMKRTCGVYAQHFNEKAGRVGHLFQERYKSEPVEDDGYLLTVFSYIHYNPTKAHIAAFDEYEWSSYHEYLGQPGICTTDFMSAYFNGAEDYRQRHLARGDTGDVLDVDGPRSATRAMPDSAALRLAQDILGELGVSELKGLERTRRNEWLALLGKAGLSVRQIERLTGIGRGSIERAMRDK